MADRFLAKGQKPKICENVRVKRSQLVNRKGRANRKRTRPLDGTLVSGTTEQ